MDTVTRLVARPLRRVAVLVGATAVALVTVSPVLGHADLTASDPADQAVLATPPTQITLTFGAGLDAGKSSFKVAGPGGSVGTATPAKDGDIEMRLDGLALAPGAYAIEWTAVAQDGDITRGQLGFTVNEPSESTDASTVPSVASAETSAPRSGAPVATTVPSRTASTGTPTPSDGGVTLPIVAALALVGVVGVFVLRRNRGA